VKLVVDASVTVAASATPVGFARFRGIEPEALQNESWALADEMGWAKTYDANYVALARVLDCRLVTPRHDRRAAASRDRAARVRDRAD